MRIYEKTLHMLSVDMSGGTLKTLHEMGKIAVRHVESIRRDFQL